MIHDFEEQTKTDLFQYLLAQHEIEAPMAEAPDVEDHWETICQSYLADGIREFADYPVVSLGWMMYVGMAVAQLWDTDWQRASSLPDLYLHLRTPRGYDAMDEHIREDVLGLHDEAYAATERLVGECAQRVYSRLRHSGYEAGTKDAFKAYVACLHQLYLMGARVQLLRMGYHMTPV